MRWEVLSVVAEHADDLSVAAALACVCVDAPAVHPRLVREELGRRATRRRGMVVHTELRRLQKGFEMADVFWCERDRRVRETSVVRWHRAGDLPIFTGQYDEDGVPDLVDVSVPLLRATGTWTR